MNVQYSKESSIIQSPASTNGDSRIYSNNNATSITRTSSPILKRDGHTNGGDVDTVIQRQTSWPTAVTTDQQDDENDNEGKSFYINSLIKISIYYSGDAWKSWEKIFGLPDWYYTGMWSLFTVILLYF